MSDPSPIPVPLRVHLAHATVQAIAERCNADVLHIKGPAAVGIRETERHSSDSDALVRPSHLDRLAAGLRAAGWQAVTELPTGGLVEHSTNWYHGELGQLDLHVRFPGIRLPAEQAFDLLWMGRSDAKIAHRPCAVPGHTAHRLILLLHAARDLPLYQEEVEAVWGRASREEQTRIRELARDLDAEVPLAAAIGELELHRQRPEYRLWSLYSDGGITTTGVERVWAEAQAAPNRGPRSILTILSYAWYIVTHMDHRLETELGRKPTAQEVRAGYGMFLRRAVRWGRRTAKS